MRPTLRAVALALPVLCAAGSGASAACPPDAAVAAYAEALVSGRPTEPMAGLSLDDAACARDKLVPILARSWGAPAGYKAAATGEGVQKLYGLPGPVWGVVFERTLSLRSGAEVPLSEELRGLAVEADLLVRIKDAGIADAGADHVAILRHLDQVIPLIELPRAGTSRRPDGPGLVAGNSAARLGVLGAAIPVEATAGFAARLGTMSVALADDGREIARAPGTALLGHPLNVLPWLAADLARSGRALKAGDIVSLGGFAPSVPAEAGHRYELRYDGLAEQPITVSVRIR